MKTLITLLCFVSIAVNAQKNQVKEVKNQDLSHFMGSLVEFKSYGLEKARLGIATIQNESGSAAAPGTDESDQNLYLSLCGLGEQPDCKLFKVEHLTAVHVEKVLENKNGVNVLITYGNFNQKKSDTIIIPYPAN